MISGGRFLRVLFVFVGGFMAGCVADSSSGLDNKAALGLQDAESGVVVSLTAVNSQVPPDGSVELTFSIQNFTEQNFRVLPWGTPLETILSADIFDVIYADKVLPYRGRVVKRAPPGESDYLDVVAGGVKEVMVNVSQAYDTEAAGSYLIQLKAVGGEYQMRERSVKILTEPVMIERL